MTTVVTFFVQFHVIFSTSGDVNKVNWCAVWTMLEENSDDFLEIKTGGNEKGEIKEVGRTFLVTRFQFLI